MRYNKILTVKRTVCFLCLCSSLIAPAQNKAANDTVAIPFITEAEKPDGSKTEIRIIKDGCLLKSPDGK